MKSAPPSPAFAALIPNLQGPLIGALGLSLFLYLLTTANHYGRKLVQALNTLEESATQIASGNLDFEIQDTAFTEFNPGVEFR